jgi:Ca2+-binding EF-hand superfamily protein
MVSRTFVMLLILSATIVGCARGQGPRAAQMSHELQRRFALADRNGDGRLDREEARSGMPRVFGNFDAIDTSRTGYITIDQLRQYAASHGRQRQRPGGEVPL